MSGYSLAVSYLGDALVSGFNWINTTDLSGGFVSYQNQQDALSRGLYSVDEATEAVTLRVDTTSVYAADGSEGGRPSVRIESKLPVNKGLVIGDFAHMPGSVCGSWPAFWMYGPNWPNNGEVDIIEGANTALKNLMSAHTADGCTLPATGFTGSQSNTDCTSPGSNGDLGCSYVTPTSDSYSYGDTFNSIGGGVYALEWTDAAIKIWHFPRTAIPSDITAKQPDPSSWGEPEALFGGSDCDVDDYFNDMSIVLNMDFCGAYAGNLWGVTDTCNVDTGSTCVDWVANNPAAFTNVYWEINYIDVYDATTSDSTTTALPAPSSTQTPLTSRVLPDHSLTVDPSTIPTPEVSIPVTESLPTTGSPSPSASMIESESSVVGTPPVLTSGTPSLPTTGATSPSSSIVESESTAVGTPPILTSGTPSLTSPASTSTGEVDVTSASDVPQPTPTGSLTRDPASIGDFVLLGCYGSNTSFPTFTSAGSDTAMTPEICVGLCSTSKYAGVFDETCYCADTLDAASSALSDIDQCSQLCPGNPAEFCGGLQNIDTSPNGNGTFSNSTTSVARRLIRRATLSPNVLLTVYGNLSASPDPQPAPALGNPSGPTGIVMPATTATAHMTTITTTLTYTTVCSTNPAELVVVEYCSTFTVEDCVSASQTQPEIPMTTVVQSCDACGTAGESIVTLTVPAAVVASATATNVAAVTNTANAAAVAASTYTVAKATTAANAISATATSTPVVVVTAGASVSAMSKGLMATVLGGMFSFYLMFIL